MSEAKWTKNQNDGDWKQWIVREASVLEEGWSTHTRAARRWAPGQRGRRARLRPRFAGRKGMIVNADRVSGRVTGLTGDGVWAGNIGDAAAMGRLRVR